MSLRFRLTLLYSLLFAALLTLFGVIVYLRTLVWFVSVAGLVMIIKAML